MSKGPTLTHEMVVFIERLINTSTMDDVAIAQKFDLPTETIKALRRERSWSRSKLTYEVGLRRKLSVAEIASIVGCKPPTIQRRIDRGVRGRALLNKLQVKQGLTE